MAERQYFIMERHEEILTLTMNQPELLNRLSLEVQSEFLEILADLAEDRTLHGVVITGAGRAFAAGADIAQMVPMGRKEGERLSELGQTVFNDLEALDKITVAAVNGAAIGGGCEIALACDYRIAEENAKFSQAEVKVGLIPGWGGTRRLPRLVGLAEARDMILTGKMVSADEAKEIGLVDRVVEAGQSVEAGKALLKELFAASPVTVKYAKEALRAGVTRPGGDAEMKERELFARCFENPDRAESMKAFLEKRPPKR